MPFSEDTPCFYICEGAGLFEPPSVPLGVLECAVEACCFAYLATVTGEGSHLEMVSGTKYTREYGLGYNIFSRIYSPTSPRGS